MLVMVCRTATRDAWRGAGGTRMSEQELELLALAEYVQELEAALARERSLPKFMPPREAAQPPAALGSPAVPRDADKGSMLPAPHREEEGARAAVSVHVVGDAGGGRNSEVGIRGEEGVDSVERLPENGNQTVAKAIEQELSELSSNMRTKRWIGLWGYITGADKVVHG